LDYIAEYPRDHATQYYYPAFRIRDFELPPDVAAPLPPPHLSPMVAALLMDIPQPTQEVKDITGHGYPSLERTGLLMFTGSARQ
jgi:hypothetical protein